MNTHRVIKEQRGTNGEWFCHQTAARFASEELAREYAERFAREQSDAGVTGTRIRVRTAGKHGKTVVLYDVR